MKRIDRITIERTIDENPDLSYLGEYHSSTDKVTSTTIRRRKAGTCEHKYFNPAMSGEESGNPISPHQDYERMEAYDRGEWWMIGVRAVARIIVNDTIQTIQSGGLWGIESDSDTAFMQEVAKEQLDDLAEQLFELGFSAKQVADAMPSEGVGD